MSDCCCPEATNDGVPASSSSGGGSRLLVFEADAAVTADVFVDLFAGQAAPQNPTCQIPPITLGGVQFEIDGTILNNSGNTRVLELQISLDAVVLYRAQSQAIGSNAASRAWRASGKLTRKAAATCFASFQMFSTNGTPGAQDVGLGFFSATGGGLSPSMPLATNIILAADWTITQRLRFDMRWTQNVANLAFTLRGGDVRTF